MTVDQNIENVALPGLEQYEVAKPEQGDVVEAPEAAPAADDKPEARDELERIDPQPIESKLQSGMDIDIEPLRLRQFLRLLRIVTRGAAGVLDTSTLSLANEDTFVQELIALVMFSVPEAEEESIDFIKSMVKPQGPFASEAAEIAARATLEAELDNPELEDVVTIIQLTIEREGSDLRALGKRLNGMFKVAQKMGAAPK